MKIGEMKAQAISLMLPNVAVKLDESSNEEIIRAIYEMKSDPNLESILEASVGAINRALSYLEASGLSMTKCVDVPSSSCERQGDKAIIKLEDDFMWAERVLLHTNDVTYALGFEKANGVITTEYMNGVYTVVYKPQITRITRTTSDAYDIILPYGIAEFIPYYIVSDLAREENPELAEYAYENFERAVNRIERQIAPCDECFQLVYKWD